MGVVFLRLIYTIIRFISSHINAKIKDNYVLLRTIITLNTIVMKNVFLSVVCFIMIFSGCSAPAEKQTQSASCAENKESMQVVMNLPRKILPEHVAAYKASFEKCKTPTLQEPGCLDYAMYQSYTDSTEFLIYEVWENKGEHLKHMETEHLKTHLQEIKGMGDPSFKGKGSNVYVCPNVN